MTLVMWERDVSTAYPSGMVSTGSSPAAALFALRSATSLPEAPLCAGTHRMVTLLSYSVMREQTSIAANAMRFVCVCVFHRLAMTMIDYYQAAMCCTCKRREL